jgi:hypothetical protein
MIARIGYELGSRTDLVANGSVQSAINDAIQIYQKERFRFNELQPIAPFVINTVQGQAIYTVADDVRIPTLYKIDYINYLLGNTVEKMDRGFPEEVYLALQNIQMAGPPQLWAWDGNSIVIYPRPPSTVYPLTIGGYLAFPGPVTTTDTTNPWMNEAERLIRSRAKYEIALHITRNDKMIAAMSPDEGSGGASERYYDELKGEANKIRGTSRVRAMRF